MTPASLLASAAVAAFSGAEIAGRPVALHPARVSKVPLNTPWPGHQRPEWQTEIAAWCQFELDGPATLAVTPAREWTEAVVRPLAKGVRAERRPDGAIALALPGPGYYTLELDGYHEALMVFAVPRRTFVPRPGNTVRRLGPGVHDLGRVELGSRETLLLEEGAVLRGSVFAFGAEGAEILGRGVIDGSAYVRGGARGFGAIDNSLGDGGGNAVPMLDGAQAPADREGFDRLLAETACMDGSVRFYRCRDVRIDGPVLFDSPLWSVAAANCDGVEYREVKQVGMWRYNSDGFDCVNSRNVHVSGSFFRNFDDCMVIKGIPGFDAWNNENYLVEGCVFWCDWGRPLEIGAETVADEYRNIVFRDCDILHGSTVNLDVQHHNRADIHDVLFENIRVEYTKHQLSDVIDSNTDNPYPDPRPVRHPLLVEIPLHDFWHFTRDERHGRAHDIVFRDIRVLRDDPSVPPPKCAFKGLSADHDVRGITLENFTLDGEPFVPEIVRGPFVGDITVR